MIADLIAAGLQEGYKVFKSPTIPEMWGHDMDVPESKLNWTWPLLNSSFVDPSASVKAAITNTPGAVISGWKCKQ